MMQFFTSTSHSKIRLGALMLMARALMLCSISLSVVLLFFPSGSMTNGVALQGIFPRAPADGSHSGSTTPKPSIGPEAPNPSLLQPKSANRGSDAHVSSNPPPKSSGTSRTPPDTSKSLSSRPKFTGWLSANGTHQSNPPQSKNLNTNKQPEHKIPSTTKLQDVKTQGSSLPQSSSRSNDRVTDGTNPRYNSRLQNYPGVSNSWSNSDPYNNYRSGNGRWNNADYYPSSSYSGMPISGSPNVPTCQTLNNGNTNPSNNYVRPSDCYEALRFFSQDRNGNGMAQISNSYKSKACGYCRLRFETNQPDGISAPMNTIRYGSDRGKAGGLAGLLDTCQKRGGSIIVPAGTNSKHTFRLQVSRTANYHDCSNGNRS